MSDYALPAPSAALLAAELLRIGLTDAADRAGPLSAWLADTVPSAGLKDWGGAPLPSGRTLIMGVVNVTDASLSGDGLGADLDATLAHAEALVAAGADVLDVGGEST